MTNGQPAVPLGTRPWESLMESCDDGNILEELDGAVVEIVAALKADQAARGGKPKASITVKVDLRLDGAHVFIAADVVTKKPKRARNVALMFPTKDNVLAKNDPRQTSLGLSDKPLSAPALQVMPNHAAGGVQ